MSKRITEVFAVLCAILLALPFVAMPFSVGSTSMENRDAAPAPQLVLEDGQVNGQFAQDCEDFLSDHFALRSQLIALNAWINMRLLHTTPSKDIVLGSDDMLFFTKTLADYEGTEPLSVDELQAIRRNLLSLSLALSQQGSRLVIAVAPNKNSVYPERMPSVYKAREGEGNVDRLREIVQDVGIEWVDLASALAAAKTDGPVYLSTDTHWNDRGAYIAAQSILSALDLSAPEIAKAEDITYTGDLARMTGLGDGIIETTQRLTAEGAPEGADYSEHLLTVNAGGEGRLLLLRDSFGTAIAPFLASAYEETELRWETPFDATPEADDVVMLIAERNIRQYLLASIVHIAPEVTMPEASAEQGCELEAFEARGIATLDFRFPGLDAQDGYIELDGTAYQASPASDRDDDPGWFQALVRADALDEDMQVRCIAACADGSVYASDATWRVGDMLSLDADSGEGDDDDDYEWLQQLRREMEEDAEDGL